MQRYSGFKKKKSKLGSTLTLVAGLHIVMAAGVIWLASTSAGREIIEVYKVKILNIPSMNSEPSTPVPPVKSPPSAPTAKDALTPQQKAAPEPPPPLEADAPATEETASEEAASNEEPSAESSPTEVAGVESSETGPMEASIGRGFSGPSMEGGADGGAIGNGTGSGIETGSPAESSGAPVRLPGSGNPFATSGGGGGGGRGGRKFSGYGDLVTSEIQKYYKQPADLPGNLRSAVFFQLRVDDEGRLLDFKLVNSSGNPLFDESALQALSNIKKLRPPPQGMSKTLTVKFFPPTG